MNLGSLTLSVRLWHQSMAPEDISAAMQATPNVVHAVGAERKTPAGKPIGGQYHESYWANTLDEREDADLAEAVNVANEWMRHRVDFLREFSQTGGRVDYYVTITANDRLAVELTPNVLAECVQFGAQLSIEVFSGQLRE